MRDNTQFGPNSASSKVPVPSVHETVHETPEGEKSGHNDCSGPNLHHSGRRVCIGSRRYRYEEQMGDKCKPD
jgi:hypothetical protein